MLLFAKPQKHSPWLMAMAKLAAFEQAHLVHDPDLGLVVQLNTPDEIQEYQALVDSETFAFNDTAREEIAITPLHVVQ
jgi:hypothetical protein